MNDKIKVKPLNYWRGVINVEGDDLNAEAFSQSWRTCAVGEGLAIQAIPYQSPDIEKALKEVAYDVWAAGVLFPTRYADAASDGDGFEEVTEVICNVENEIAAAGGGPKIPNTCLLYTSPSPRD